MDNPLRQIFFHAGHAHAGVIIILSLICQVLADSAALPGWLLWIVSAGIPAAAIFLPLGLFLSVASPNSVAPKRAVLLIYVGAAVLAFFGRDSGDRTASRSQRRLTGHENP
jgi:hypothetical protein